MLYLHCHLFKKKKKIASLNERLCKSVSILPQQPNIKHHHNRSKQALLLLLILSRFIIIKSEADVSMFGSINVENELGIDIALLNQCISQQTYLSSIYATIAPIPLIITPICVSILSLISLFTYQSSIPLTPSLFT